MKRTLIAAAVLVAASGSAFAAPQKAYLFNATLIGEAVGVEGLVGLYGCVHVSSTAGAVINNSQTVNVNATLNPQAQSYTTGRVTTSYDNNTSSIKGGGSVFAVTSQSHSQSAVGAQGYQASGGYVYGSQSASVAGGGYQTSQQAAGIAGGFTHTSQNAGGHIAAGGSIGGNYNYAAINTPFIGGGTFHAAGGLQAGYNESSYANTSGLAGGFEATEASGQVEWRRDRPRQAACARSHEPVRAALAACGAVHLRWRSGSVGQSRPRAIGAGDQRRLDHRQRCGRWRDRRARGQRNGRPEQRASQSDHGVDRRRGRQRQRQRAKRRRGRQAHERAGDDRSQCFFEFIRCGAGEPVRRSRESAAQQHPIGHCGARSRDRLGWGAIRDGPEKRWSGSIHRGS